MKKSKVIIFLIILLSFAIAVYLYPKMPARMASHWNFQGNVDGYMPKFWGLFLMPFISVIIVLLLIFLPKIDPLKANIEKFRKYFDGFIILMMLFLLYIYLLSIYWNLGGRFNMGRLMAPALAILFYYCGVLIEKAKRNWFIGIRTPWTLSSDRVWDKTHRLGGKLFKIAGVIALLGIFFPNSGFYLVLIPVIATSFYAIVYSYFEYQKEKKYPNEV